MFKHTSNFLKYNLLGDKKKMKFSLFLLLLNLVHMGMSSDQILIMKYTQGIAYDCPSVTVPIATNSVLDEFTYCGKYSFRFLRESVLMALDGSTYLWMMNYEDKMAAVKAFGKYVFFYYENQIIKPDQWQHFCVSISLHQVKVVLNGEIICNAIVNLRSKEIEYDKLWIGGLEKSQWHKERRFEGSITDVHMWNKSLEFHHLTSITSKDKSSHEAPSPDLFTWTTFKTSNDSSCVKYIMLDQMEELLLEKSQTNVLIEYLADFNASNYLCQAFGGELLVPKNDLDLHKSQSLVQKSNLCSYAFLGLTKFNDTMAIDLRGQPTSFIKWAENQPNGGNYQQCITIWDSAFDDGRCFAKTCFLCQIKAQNIFTLRGNLSNSIERKYVVKMTNQKTEIRGLLKTECDWNRTWNFGHGLEIDSASNMPPVGVRTWNNGKVLKFTNCNDNEFTCHTYGNCISTIKRCDGNLDCPVDGSDEKDCKIITRNIGYDRKYPSKKNNTVFISLTVNDIVDINELHMSYHVNIEIILKWFDSRIIFRNLKPKRQENQLDSFEIGELWTPEIYFLYSNEVHIKAGEKREGSNGIVQVQQKGQPKPNELSEIDEDYMYPGTENPIEMVTYLVVKLGCKFDLTWYIYIFYYII